MPTDSERFSFAPGAPDYPTVVGGEGVWLHTADGRRILDGAAGAIVGNIGWGRSEVVNAAPPEPSWATSAGVAAKW